MSASTVPGRSGSALVRAPVRPTFFARVAQSRKRIPVGAAQPPTNRTPTFLLRPPSILSRVYKRDSKGRFGSGGGDGDGVREELVGASTIEEINTAASAEAKRITGRDIPFDMTGSDLTTAKEHSEGIMRGLERFPDARLDRVEVERMGDGTWAHADGGTIRFNTTYASPAGRKRYKIGRAHV